MNVRVVGLARSQIDSTQIVPISKRAQNYLEELAIWIENFRSSSISCGHVEREPAFFEGVKIYRVELEQAHFLYRENGCDVEIFYLSNFPAEKMWEASVDAAS